MAISLSSTSIKMAQVPISCNLCNENAIKWKCEECDILMCDSCKCKIHERMKSTKDHEVISFCNKREDPTASTEVSSEVISSTFNSYTTLAVSNLLCSDDDIVFILPSTKKGQDKLIKGKILKNSIRTLMSLDEHIFDIAVDKNGDVLFTQLSEVAESPIRMLLIPSGEIKTVLDPKPMRLLALHLNKDNELICGLREQGSPLPVHEFSVRQVVVFGKDYKKKITIETDINGTKLFRYPARIRTDSKNNIYVLDFRDTDQTGRIVATDKSGRLKFTYCGPNDFESFMPTSIVITPSDNIVLSVKSPDALLVLSSKGNLIAKQFVHELDITTPSALCIDSEGFLLIGSVIEDEDESYSGKIHVVQMADILM